MNSSDLLTWWLEEMRHTELRNYANILELNNFSITKDADYDRMISWKRIPKLYAKPPPFPDLPDPSLFQLMRAEKIKQCAIYLDVPNMFHNMDLSKLMKDLFTLTLIKYGALDD